jgi:preprotein translocase subunit YajC
LSVSSEQLSSLVPLVLILAAAYLLLIRPARKRAHDVNALQRSLEIGSEVMLTSGIYGEVVQIDEERVHVEVAPGVVLTVHRGAISKIVSELPSDVDADAASDEPPYDETAAEPSRDDDNGTDTDTRGAH